MRVVDNGIGIDASQLDQLFAPFTQADESTARKYGGTGLGISISQRLVALMGGQITVQSTLGQGAEFRVDLPMKAAPAGAPAPVTPSAQRVPHEAQPAPTAPTSERARSQGRLVLLAEDNPLNCDVMVEQLHLLGYAVEVAVDGEKALEMWRKSSYALLLTDCHMPLMDGFALTAAIRREESAGTRLPIVAVTANALQGEAKRCLDAGMDDYLTKPLRLVELAAKMNQWLPLRRHAAAAVWDPTVLAEMVGDNPAMRKRLMDSFLLNTREQVKAIGAAVSIGDAAAAGELAHKLKSSARSVGAMVLGELCQQMDTAGTEADASSCAVLNAPLQAAFAEVAEIMTKFVDPTHPFSG
jgi:CheY-like chemotaxis protein/HPt (histidine-containing phosphotransfer) domain-containing protein